MTKLSLLAQNEKRARIERTKQRWPVVCFCFLRQGNKPFHRLAIDNFNCQLNGDFTALVQVPPVTQLIVFFFLMESIDIVYDLLVRV